MLSLVANACVLNISNRDVHFQNDLPKWVKKTININKRLYFLKILKINLKFERLAFKLGPILGLKRMNFSEIESEIRKLEYESVELEQILINNPDKNQQLFLINNKLAKICDDLKEKASDDYKILKWKYFATCLDKLFFYLATFSFFISFVSTILLMPNLYQ